MVHCALTTVDNPYDPLDDYTHWWQYEVSHGYNTSGVLMRFAEVSDQLTDVENDYEIERAIDYIIANDVLNMYKKVKKNEDGTPFKPQNE